MEDCSTVSAAAIGRGGVRTVKAENRESYILKWNAGMCCRRRRLSIPILKNHLRRHGRAMKFMAYSDQGEAEPCDKDCVTVDAAVLNVACASFSASPCQEMKEGKNIDSAATTTCAHSCISLYCA